MPCCEIISVGTELLIGDILNTNSRYLSRELALLGINVLHHSSVGDNRERLSNEIRQALERSDIIIFTGGLGPTEDDLTKEICCDILGFELITDEFELEYIRSFFKNRKAAMPLSNDKQALIPKDGTVLHNSCGTAPGIIMEKDGKTLILLPGPPREVVPMFENSVKPFLQKYSEGTIVSHTINCFGIGESRMAELAGDYLNLSNPTVAPYAKDGEALLRISAKAENADEAHALCAPIISKLTELLNGYVYGTDCESLQKRIYELLLERQMIVAFAESCTGGYTAKRLTDIPGSSNVFHFGVVSYSNDIKMKLLNVSESTLNEHGAVSSQTAIEMAQGILALSGADIGVSLTGIAGPGTDETDKPEGLCFIALADKNNTYCERIETGHRNEREYNRYVFSSHALNLIRRYILGEL